MSDIEEEDEWGAWWKARMSAMERILGKSDDVVGHATIPFDIGHDLGGGTDIVYFKQHLDGVVYVTSELIGRDDQVPNKIGNYELMICHREDDDWGPDIISDLAYYTLRAELNPGETMDIGEATPDDSTIDALLFFNYGSFTVRGRKAGLLLCVGITAAELAKCQAGHRGQVEQALNTAGVLPFTDLYRKSLV